LFYQTAKRKKATPGQISMTNMLCKKLWIVPISGPRKAERLKENADATDVELTDAAIKALDDALDTIPMSAVFGGTRLNGK